MNKATILLITLAALGLGALIGTNLGNKQSDAPATTTAAPVTQTSTAPVATGGAPALRFYGPDDVTVVPDEFGRAAPNAVGENFIGRDREFKTETVTISLAGDSQIEYKAVMNQGDSIVYSWSTDGGDVYYDFHAHDDAFGNEFFSRYAEGEGSDDSGMIVAAYSGQHGWFLLNLEEGETVVTLNVSGFYDEIIEVDLEAY